MVIAEETLKAMRPGKAEKITVKPKLDPGTTVSNQFLIAIIDVGNDVDECDETNNIKFFGPLE